MTEHEFDILDELYFVVSYPDLRSTLSLTDEELCQGLQSLLEKGYIRIMLLTVCTKFRASTLV